MRLNDLGVGKLEAPKLRPEIIKIKAGHNYREMNSTATRQHIEWLKNSIREEGVKKPIDVSFVNGEVFLEAGECRLTAAQELRKEGWDGYIPCFPIKGDEADILAKSILDNTALPPTMLEFGKAVQRLVNFGWELEAVAKIVPSTIASDATKALRFVKDSLELHQAPIEVKKAVSEGVEGVQVSPALALAATRKNRIMSSEIVKEAAKEAKAKGKKVARRPKGDGVATKAKKAKAAETDAVLEAADKLAELALDDDVLLADVKKAAKYYLKVRGK